MGNSQSSGASCTNCLCGQDTKSSHSSDEDIVVYTSQLHASDFIAKAEPITDSAETETVLWSASSTDEDFMEKALAIDEVFEQDDDSNSPNHDYINPAISQRRQAKRKYSYIKVDDQLSQSAFGTQYHHQNPLTNKRSSTVAPTIQMHMTALPHLTCLADLPQSQQRHQQQQTHMRSTLNTTISADQTLPPPYSSPSMRTMEKPRSRSEDFDGFFTSPLHAASRSPSMHNNHAVINFADNSEDYDKAAKKAAADFSLDLDHDPENETIQLNNRCLVIHSLSLGSPVATTVSRSKAHDVHDVQLSSSEFSDTLNRGQQETQQQPQCLATVSVSNSAIGDSSAFGDFDNGAQQQQPSRDTSAQDVHMVTVPVVIHAAGLTITPHDESPPVDVTMPLVYAIDPFVDPSAAGYNSNHNDPDTKESSHDVNSEVNKITNNNATTVITNTDMSIDTNAENTTNTENTPDTKPLIGASDNYSVEIGATRSFDYIPDIHIYDPHSRTCTADLMPETAHHSLDSHDLPNSGSQVAEMGEVAVEEVVEEAVDERIEESVEDDEGEENSGRAALSDSYLQRKECEVQELTRALASSINQNNAQQGSSNNSNKPSLGTFMSGEQWIMQRMLRAYNNALWQYKAAQDNDILSRNAREMHVRAAELFVREGMAYQQGKEGVCEEVYEQAQRMVKEALHWRFEGQSNYQSYDKGHRSVGNNTTNNNADFIKAINDSSANESTENANTDRSMSSASLSPTL